MRLPWVLDTWDHVRAGLLSVLDAYDSTALLFAPFDASWSAGQIALHIASAEEGWFRYVVTRELAEWPADLTWEQQWTVDSIIATLSSVHDRTQTYLQGISETDLRNVVPLPWGGEWTLGAIVWHVLEHEIHHRGELSLILGMLGREGLDV